MRNAISMLPKSHVLADMRKFKCLHGYFCSDAIMVIFAQLTSWLFLGTITGIIIGGSAGVGILVFLWKYLPTCFKSDSPSPSRANSHPQVIYPNMHFFFPGWRLWVFLANNADPDEMPHYVAFHLVFIICQSTCLQVASVKVLRSRRFTGFLGWLSTESTNILN